MKFTLNFLNKSANVSREAYDLAVAYDKISKYPAVKQKLADTLNCTLKSVAAIEALEKIMPPERINATLSKSFGES